MIHSIACADCPTASATNSQKPFLNSAASGLQLDRLNHMYLLP